MLSNLCGGSLSDIHYMVTRHPDATGAATFSLIKEEVIGALAHFCKGYICRIFKNRFPIYPYFRSKSRSTLFQIVDQSNPGGPSSPENPRLNRFPVTLILLSSFSATAA